MKRSIKALVTRVVSCAGVVALTLAAATPAAHATSPVVRLEGSAWLPSSSPVASPKFRIQAAFSTDTPGAPLYTVQQVVMYFPDHAGTNGPLFPSCSVRQIERFHGDIRRCPKGSKVGTGTLRARALQLAVTANARLTMFNGPHGKSITFNIQTAHPIYLNESLVAPLTQLHGRYGEKLTLVVPHELQEILADVFVGVQSFDVTTTGTALVHGVPVSYLKARTCPTRAMRGVFDLKDWASGQTATVTTDAKVRCSLRR